MHSGFPEMRKKMRYFSAFSKDFELIQTNMLSTSSGVKLLR